MVGKKFGQVECAAYLNRCQSQVEVEDVLTAYVYAKFAHGSGKEQVLRKLYLLVCYLKMSRQLGVLEQFPSALAVVQYHVQYLNGGMIGAHPPDNALGNEVWNHVRRSCYRPATSVRHTISRSTADGPQQREEEEGPSEWGARGPGALIGMAGIADKLSGRRRSRWPSVAEDLLRVTSLDPAEVRLIGREGPSYHSQTLPPYEDEEHAELTT